jgi:hypothetical protein
LREEHRLRVFEERVLTGIFASKGEEVTVNWGKIQNEKPDNLCSSPTIISDQIRKDEMGGTRKPRVHVRDLT